MALRHEAGVTTPPASASPACPPREEGEHASFESLANSYVEEVGEGDYVGVEELTSQEVPGSEGNTCDGGADLMVLSNEEVPLAQQLAVVPLVRPRWCYSRWVFSLQFKKLGATIIYKRRCFVYRFSSSTASHVATSSGVTFSLPLNLKLDLFFFLKPGSRNVPAKYETRL